MLTRCRNEAASDFARYGRRGVAVCDRWRLFDNFVADMGERPSKAHSIDRINNDGNYEPGNCRWATRKEQARNKRTSRLIEVDGVVRTLVEWSEMSGIHRGTISQRIRRGWSIRDAISLEPGATGVPGAFGTRRVA